MIETLIITAETLALAAIGMNRIAKPWRDALPPEPSDCPQEPSGGENLPATPGRAASAPEGECGAYSLLPDDWLTFSFFDEAGASTGLGVVARAKQIAQPAGGLVPLSLFEVTQLDDGFADLGPARFSGATPAQVGLAVDYLTRFMLLHGRYGYDEEGWSRAVTEAFDISIAGGDMLAQAYGIDNPAEAYLDDIRGLDCQSIASACKLVTLDAVFRAGLDAAVPTESVAPDQDTVAAVGRMVNRTLRFLFAHGTVTEVGPTFEGGYTHLVGAGDGDYLTDTTIWDIKCLRGDIDETATLQLAMYYAMARHSAKLCYTHLDSMGFFNPRRNISYFLKADSIPEEVIRTIERDVLGYTSSILDQ